MADQASISDADVTSAAEKLIQQLKADKAVSNPFCDCWPCARRILLLLKTVVPPGLKAAIDALIKIGDKIAAGVCSSK